MTKEDSEYHRKRGAEILAQIDAARKRPKPRKLSERTARITIGMMRTLGRNIPINPFILYAADQMEQLLNEVVEARKK